MIRLPFPILVLFDLFSRPPQTRLLRKQRDSFLVAIQMCIARYFLPPQEIPSSLVNNPVCSSTDSFKFHQRRLKKFQTPPSHLVFTKRSAPSPFLFFLLLLITYPSLGNFPSLKIFTQVSVLPFSFLFPKLLICLLISPFLSLLNPDFFSNNLLAI